MLSNSSKKVLLAVALVSTVSAQNRWEFFGHLENAKDTDLNCQRLWFIIIVVYYRSQGIAVGSRRPVFEHGGIHFDRYLGECRRSSYRQYMAYWAVLGRDMFER